MGVHQWWSPPHHTPPWAPPSLFLLKPSFRAHLSPISIRHVRLLTCAAAQRSAHTNNSELIVGPMMWKRVHAHGSVGPVTTSAHSSHYQLIIYWIIFWIIFILCCDWIIISGSHRHSIFCSFFFVFSGEIINYV